MPTVTFVNGAAVIKGLSPAKEDGKRSASVGARERLPAASRRKSSRIRLAAAGRGRVPSKLASPAVVRDVIRRISPDGALPEDLVLMLAPKGADGPTPWRLVAADGGERALVPAGFVGFLERADGTRGFRYDPARVSAEVALSAERYGSALRPIADCNPYQILSESLGVGADRCLPSTTWPETVRIPSSLPVRVGDDDHAAFGLFPSANGRPCLAAVESAESRRRAAHSRVATRVLILKMSRGDAVGWIRRWASHREGLLDARDRRIALAVAAIAAGGYPGWPGSAGHGILECGPGDIDVGVGSATFRHMAPYMRKASVTIRDPVIAGWAAEAVAGPDGPFAGLVHEDLRAACRRIFEADVTPADLIACAAMARVERAAMAAVAEVRPSREKPTGRIVRKGIEAALSEICEPASAVRMVPDACYVAVMAQLRADDVIRDGSGRTPGTDPAQFAKGYLRRLETALIGATPGRIPQPMDDNVFAFDLDGPDAHELDRAYPIALAYGSA